LWGEEERRAKSEVGSGRSEIGDRVKVEKCKFIIVQILKYVK